MRHFILLPSLLLAACATTANDLVVTERAGTCRNDGLAAFVGQPATDALAAQMLRASSAYELRWVAKGTMVTMDYSPQRLTVYLDAANRIESVNCG